MIFVHGIVYTHYLHSIVSTDMLVKGMSLKSPLMLNRHKRGNTEHV